MQSMSSKPLTIPRKSPNAAGLPPIIRGNHSGSPLVSYSGSGNCGTDLVLSQKTFEPTFINKKKRTRTQMKTIELYLKGKSEINAHTFLINW